MGGLIEIQPDSFTGGHVPACDATSERWGFPMSLNEESRRTIREEMFRGDGCGIRFIRFPMGFAYRGYRNCVDGLAKNIGERWAGQNRALREWFADVAETGGGLDVEYWSPAPYWLTGGAYYAEGRRNELNAGGAYPRERTLASIKASDPDRYRKRIDEYTDAVVDDLEYVHRNVCPVRLYTLAAEPTGGGETYGHAHWDSAVYCDTFEALHPKVAASEVLRTFRDRPNEVLLHACADDHGWTIGREFLRRHPDWIWGYSSDLFRKLNGEEGPGADFLKSDEWKSLRGADWTNVFTCEYEYFDPEAVSDERKCANNMARLLNELVYGEAKILMPIIHVCKPEGQTHMMANTKGYSMYAVDMSTGAIRRNEWAFRSWALIGDNLPAGADFVNGGDCGLPGVTCVHFVHAGRTILLCANQNDSERTLRIESERPLSLSVKRYDIARRGTPVGAVSGRAFPVVIPPCAALALT